MGVIEAVDWLLCKNVRASKEGVGAFVFCYWRWGKFRCGHYVAPYAADGTSLFVGTSTP